MEFKTSRAGEARASSAGTSSSFAPFTLTTEPYAPSILFSALPFALPSKLFADLAPVAFVSHLALLAFVAHLALVILPAPLAPIAPFALFKAAEMALSGWL